MCFVEGLNCEYKFTNQTNTDPGTLVKQEQPLLVTTGVALVDPSENKATDTEWRYTEDGVRVRVSMKTGRIIPFSTAYYEETEDFVNTKTYKECSKDTKEQDLTAVTFKPKLCTFEDDIMEQMGIKETRKRQEKFWY